MSYVATPSQDSPAMARQAGDPVWLTPAFIRRSNTGHEGVGWIAEVIQAGAEIAQTVKQMDDQRKAARTQKQAADNAAKAAEAQAKAYAEQASAQQAAAKSPAASGRGGSSTGTIAVVGIGAVTILGAIWLFSRRRR